MSFSGGGAVWKGFLSLGLFIISLEFPFIYISPFDIKPESDFVTYGLFSLMTCGDVSAQDVFWGCP